jgi:hypothetical protein
LDVVLADQQKEDLAGRAIDRLLKTAHGVWLTTELCTVLREPSTNKLTSRVRVSFVDALPQGASDGLGCFRPATRFADVYEIFVRNASEDLHPDTIVFGEYPANSECAVVFLYREPESWMAQTLYHELLHVWFLHARAGQELEYPTGHGNAGRCEFEAEFLLLLDAFARELAALEGRAPERLLPFRQPDRGQGRSSAQ